MSLYYCPPETYTLHNNNNIICYYEAAVFYPTSVNVTLNTVRSDAVLLVDSLEDAAFHSRSVNLWRSLFVFSVPVLCISWASESSFMFHEHSFSNYSRMKQHSLTTVDTMMSLKAISDSLVNSFVYLSNEKLNTKTQSYRYLPQACCILNPLNQRAQRTEHM